MPHKSGSKPLLIAWSISHFVGAVLGLVVRVPLYLLALALIAVIGGVIYFPASLYLSVTSNPLTEDSLTAEELCLSSSDMIAGFFGLPPEARETSSSSSSSSSSAAAAAASVSASAASGVAPETSDGAEESTPAVLLRFQERHAITTTTTNTPTTEALSCSEGALRQSAGEKSIAALPTAAQAEPQVVLVPATVRAQSMKRLHQQQAPKTAAPQVTVKPVAPSEATDTTTTTTKSPALTENSQPEDEVFTPAQKQLLARIATHQARLAHEQE